MAKKKSTDFKLSTKAKNKLRNLEKLKLEMAKGKSAQEILEISPEMMSRFKSAAYRLFAGKRYAEATNAFLFLVTLNPYNHDYWLGLGMSTQMCHEYESAIDAYEMAASLSHENPIPFFYLAKCLFSIHDRESALLAVDLALEYAGDLDEYKELREQAEQAKKLLLRDQ
ncbi:SycD/LcrH family type III secretion system chaperone [Criblamydia sequanensis]|uniref:Type III secretion chaperone SycD/LcrH n=1 Tax=Candidatus Criblamydia sequanensis CRIB-18 TaxID=1437425 RepID=A0A090CYX4_9BACT|nr:SycD/LcrH family type III secretion system chaperone [Criblamydia sequanensis]CDR33806.1 Putative type III secretion chaperone SycD/LcrH [Criblamydia sequanensis CRIB-18]